MGKKSKNEKIITY
jgi:hypothetical protein